MRFPNAYEGVKKLFTSQILQIIAGALLLIAAFSLVITGVAASGASNGGQVTDAEAIGILGAAGISGVFGIGGLVVSIVAFVLMILGLNKGKIDEPNFKNALICIIASLVISIISGFVPGVGGKIISEIGNIASFIANIFIIFGVRHLAIEVNDSAVEKKSNTLLYIIIAVNVLAIIAGIIAAVTTSNTGSSISSILSSIASILNIVSIVLFLVLLAKAKNMLAAA